MKTDIEIAQAADIQPITKIAEKIGLSLMISNFMVNTKLKFL